MINGQRQHNRVKIVFTINGARTTGQPHAKNKNENIDTDLILFKKINSKWITSLNAVHKTTKKWKEI